MKDEHIHILIKIDLSPELQYEHEHDTLQSDYEHWHRDVISKKMLPDLCTTPTATNVIFGSVIGFRES